MMPQFFADIDLSVKAIAVKEADTLLLGEHTPQLVMAHIAHWPEVMVTYEQKEKILFTADAFGQVWCVMLRKPGEWVDETRRYYFNICGKYGMQVQTLLKKAAKLDIACICSLHGPLLNENLGFYVVEEKSMKVAAEKLAEMLRAKGENVVLFNLTRGDMAEAVELAFRYDKLVVASYSYSSYYYYDDDASVFL